MSNPEWIERAMGNLAKEARSKRQVLLLTEEEDAAFRARCAETGIPASTLIREALKELGVI